MARCSPPVAGRRTRSARHDPHRGLVPEPRHRHRGAGPDDAHRGARRGRAAAGPPARSAPLRQRGPAPQRLADRRAAAAHPHRHGSDRLLRLHRLARRPGAVRVRLEAPGGGARHARRRPADPDHRHQPAAPPDSRAGLAWRPPDLVPAVAAGVPARPHRGYGHEIGLGAGPGTGVRRCRRRLRCGRVDGPHPRRRAGPGRGGRHPGRALPRLPRRRLPEPVYR
jgi:hypothetical protein